MTPETPPAKTVSKSALGVVPYRARDARAATKVGTRKFAACREIFMAYQGKKAGKNIRTSMKPAMHKRIDARAISISVFMAAFLLLSPGFVKPAFAALAVVDTGTLDQNANADPWTFNATVASGVNLLVVGCHVSGAVTFDGTTYNSVAMTPVTSSTADTATKAAFWRLVNPDVGTLQVAVNYSATQDGGCFWRTYSGADTTNPIEDFTSTNGDSLAPGDVAITCSAGNEALDVGGVVALKTLTADLGQTEILNGDDGTNDYFASSKAGAGSTDMGWSWPGGEGTNRWSYSRICVAAAAAAPTRRPIAPIIFK